MCPLFIVFRIFFLQKSSTKYAGKDAGKKQLGAFSFVLPSRFVVKYQI